MENKNALKRLPVDYSTLKDILRDGCLYVDKTRYAYDLITQGRRYFLSRPRRFGKSLFVSTLEEVLSGNKELFKDLWIGSSDYHWQTHAVIKLDFSKLSIKSADTFEKSLMDALVKTASRLNVELDVSSSILTIIFDNLIEELQKKYTRIAILIDEYDKPLVHNLNNPIAAEAIRTIIQSFFALIKAHDHAITFAFITGVTAFSKAGLFSGINNLQMLTLNAHHVGVCGYSDQEIDLYLNSHIQAWADKTNCDYDTIRSELRLWYNGYQFYQNTPKLYNPFSVVNALHQEEFKNYWFESGNPTFLIEILKKETHVFNIDDLKVDHDILGVFDIDTIPLQALMFQAGYLTIESYDSSTKKYTLRYPNNEIKISVQKYLIEAFTHVKAHVAGKFAFQIYKALEENDTDELVNILMLLFAHIPSILLDTKEKYYHAILQMIFIASEIDAQSEFMTNKGRLDIVVHTKRYIYIIEIKFNKPVKDALAQILERGYFERFLNTGKTIVLLGLSFNRSRGKFTITHATQVVPLSN